MNFDRSGLFRFPWSRTDNPGAWIEVTDVCNFACPGCFRKNNLEGHRNLEEIKREIDFCKEKLNCSRICISGGEPLMYPHILEVVKYIRSLKLKPIMLSNGELLTADLLKKLKKAGLYQFYLHADSGQNRPGWENKTEAEMNELRQYYADLIYKTGKIRCGYNLTVRRSNLDQVQDIVRWYRKNISKVNHLSLITFRGIPEIDAYDVYLPNGKAKKELLFDNIPPIAATEEINITAIDIHDQLCEHFNDIYPAAYLNGTSVTDTFKYLVTINIGNDDKIFGEVGAKTVEIYQLLYHLFHGRFDAVIPDPGKAIFFMVFFDKRLRKAFKNYLRYILANPIRLFYRTYIQALVLQQPFEIIDNKANLCDGCINLMPYKGEFINSCRLDEYRLLGGPITVLKEKNTIYSET